MYFQLTGMFYSVDFIFFITATVAKRSCNQSGEDGSHVVLLRAKLTLASGNHIVALTSSNRLIQIAGGGK